MEVILLKLSLWYWEDLEGLHRHAGRQASGHLALGEALLRTQHQEELRCLDYIAWHS